MKSPGEIVSRLVAVMEWPAGVELTPAQQELRDDYHAQAREFLGYLAFKRCTHCGCSHRDPCLDDATACHWVTPALCSACAKPADTAQGNLELHRHA